MKKIWRFCKWPICALIAIVLIYAFFRYLPPISFFLLRTICDVDKESEVCDYMQNIGLLGDSYGIYNTFFSALAFIGLVVTLLFQIRSNNKSALVDRFYKMLDYQKSLINEISVYPVRVVKEESSVQVVTGRKVFVEYKIQLKYLMKTISNINTEKGLNLQAPDIADIAYSVFYYGSSLTWKPVMMEYLKDYDNTEVLVDALNSRLDNSKTRKYILSRPNQNFMSVYCRNMYNTIKLIDSSHLLTQKEKIDYIKVLRAQLSNAELYVLFFNLISRFGKKWIENDFVEKYQLIQNLPSKYCDGYEPKDYFPNIEYEGSEMAVSAFHQIISHR